MKNTVLFLKETLEMILLSTLSLQSQRDVLRYMVRQIEILRSPCTIHPIENAALSHEERFALKQFQEELKTILNRMELELLNN